MNGDVSERAAGSRGSAFGIDRMLMLLTGSPSIRDVLLIPLQRPQAGDQQPPPGLR